MRCCRNLFFILVSSFFSLLHASTDLSLQRALELASANNEDIKIKKTSREKFDYQYTEARSLAYPKIKGEVDWNNYLKAPVLRANFPGVGDISFPLKQPYELVMGVTLTQPVWTFGKVSTAINIANDARDVEEYSMKATKLDVEYQTKILYYAALFAKNAVEIASNSYRNAIKNKNALEARFKFGRTSRYDNVKMAADIASRKPAVLEAENNLLISLKNLKSYIGLNDDTELVLTDKLKDAFSTCDVEKLRINMIKNEPTLKALQKSSDVYQSLYKLKKADFYPSIAALASYQYTGYSHKALVGSDRMFHVFLIGLVFSVNLWDSGETYGRYKQAFKDYEISELNYSKINKAYNLQLESSVAEFNSTLNTYEANKIALDLAEKSYNISLSSFASGQVTQSQLNDAELMLSQVKMNTQKTLYVLNAILARIEKLSTEEGSL